VTTIAEVLKNNGYRTFYFNSGNPHISDKFNFLQGIDYSFESEKRAPAVLNHFRTQVPVMQKERFFAYLHFMDVHLPYYKHEYNFSFTGENRNNLLIPGYIKRLVVRTATANDFLSVNDKEYLAALYDGQIKIIDQAVKSIMVMLAEKDMIDNTVIIITADHGDEFWDHKNFEHGHILYNELIHVPLIIMGNKLAPAEIEREASLVDLYPTILEWAHISPGTLNIQGKSLLRSDRGEAHGKNEEQERSIFASGSLYGEEKYCLIKKGMKLIFNSFGEFRPLIGWKSEEKYELFCLSDDPVEQVNLRLRNPEAFLELKKELAKFISLSVEEGKSLSPGKDKELKEKLKSLGYL
jgi:arylsulfatase A-like enzyme